MKLPSQVTRSSQKTMNPIFVGIESQQQKAEQGLEFQYPRPIVQYQPKIDKIARKVAQVNNTTNWYSELEQRNLCPRLNYYQAQNEASNQVAKLHLKNIRQNLKQRIQAAKEAGNVELVTLLEQEWQELAVH